MRTMKPKKRQKLCHHCEGDVDLDVIVCPFCAADLREERPQQSRFNASVSMAKNPTEQSLYPPAYSEPAQKPILEEDVTEASILPEQELKEPATLFSSISGVLLFAIGAQLLFLGIAFLIFSDRGLLLLQFNANWWPLCLLLGIPLIIFGYRSTKEL
jgi:hypothetical protein